MLKQNWRVERSLQERHKNGRCQVYSNEYIQESLQIWCPWQGNFTQELESVFMLEKKELLSVVKDQNFFFCFFWSVIGKTPFENNKNNFFHYCHLTDKGNYFRQRRGTCLSITTRWQHTTNFSKSPPQKVFRILLLKRERSIPTEVDE